MLSTSGNVMMYCKGRKSRRQIRQGFKPEKYCLGIGRRHSRVIFSLLRSSSLLIKAVFPWDPQRNEFVWQGFNGVKSMHAIHSNRPQHAGRSFNIQGISDVRYISPPHTALQHFSNQALVFSCLQHKSLEINVGKKKEIVLPTVFSTLF